MPRVAIGQFEPTPEDKEKNLASATARCRDASDGDASLLVLPELSLSAWTDNGSGARALAEPLDGPLVTAVAALADEFQLTIVAGLYERPDDDERSRPYNTLAVVAPGRGLVATHRKTHLYDAWSYQESDEVRPGDGEVVVHDVGGLKVGLINCYEIRFPERAHQLATAGADLLAVSAAWARGPLKEEHWTLNLRARALENTVWVAGSGAVGAEVTGRSAIVDPLGVVRAELDECSATTTVVDVDADRTAAARRALPILAQRQAAYGSLVAG